MQPLCGGRGTQPYARCPARWSPRRPGATTHADTEIITQLQVQHRPQAQDFCTSGVCGTPTVSITGWRGPRLAPLYDRFTKGFATTDLQAAQALLKACG